MRATKPRSDMNGAATMTGPVRPTDARQPLDVTPPAPPALRPELREAFEASWKRNEAGYRYLAGR